MASGLAFGALPVSTTVAADAALAMLPDKSLKRVTDALSDWASKAPIAAAKALYYIDTEDPDLRYVLLQFLLSPPRTFDVDDQVEYEELIAEDMARVYAAVLEDLPERDKKRLVAGLTVALCWPDDWDLRWGDPSPLTPQP